MADREMPEGLSLADQSAYTAIRNIYAAHRAGRLSREAGAAEKRRVKRRYDLEMGERGQERKLALHRAQVIRLTEQAATAVRKDPSPENALRLVDVLDGIEREWKDEKWTTPPPGDKGGAEIRRSVSGENADDTPACTGCGHDRRQ